MKSRIFSCAILGALGVFLTVACASIPAGHAKRLALKDGDTVAFLGDSITQLAWSNTRHGYIHLVCTALEKVGGCRVVPIPAGVSGNRSRNMLARVDAAVIAKKPTWMTLSCGVNDVWHGENGTTLENFKEQITQILDKCDAAGIKVMILTATMIGEDAENAANKKLADYNAWLRETAAARGYLLADCNSAMQEAVATFEDAGKTNHLTVDGVHMNDAGNESMAMEILRAFGFSAANINTARETVWPTLR